MASAKVIDYGPSGKQLRLPVTAHSLPGAPSGFIAGARAELNKEWARFGNEPGCKEVPVLTVKKISTAGFAHAAFNDDASRAHASKCAGGGGGVEQYWAVVDGTWKPVINAQNTPPCAALKKYSFPSSIAGSTCFDGKRNVVYSHS